MAPRAARNIKSYAEANQPEKPNKRKKRGFETQEKVTKRASKVTDFPLHSLPVIEGAAAQVRGWSCGNLSKKDATLFVRAVNSLSHTHTRAPFIKGIGLSNGFVFCIPLYLDLSIPTSPMMGMASGAPPTRRCSRIYMYVFIYMWATLPRHP